MKTDLKVTVLGAGSWGTTVASLAARNADTVLWARRAEVADELNGQHTNERYLPGFTVPSQLVATADLEEAATRADVLVVGVPSKGLPDIVAQVAPHVRPWVPVLSLAKGLEEGTLRRMSEIIGELLPGRPVGVLTGPNIAREIMAGQAAAAVIGMAEHEVACALQPVFGSGLFRVYTNDDVIGCEMGGALKNVIAIATGMAEGLGVGDNTRAMVITRGLAELTRLGTAMGGRAETFAGLAGMGDLMTTCLSPHSRNRTVGERLGRGESLQEIIDDMHMVAEGVKTARLVMTLAEQLQVDVPICASIHDIVHGGAPPESAYRGLIRTPALTEAEPG